MIVLEIGQVKEFMAGFLAGSGFDHYLMTEGKLVTDVVYEIHGQLQKDFFDTEQWESIKHLPYVPWKWEREKIFSLIKGKRTPRSFQFSMMLEPSRVSAMITKYNLALRESDIAALFVNVIYEHQELKLTTGVSRKEFTMDKSLEEAWDQEVKGMFTTFL